MTLTQLQHAQVLQRQIADLTKALESLSIGAPYSMDARADAQAILRADLRAQLQEAEREFAAL